MTRITSTDQILLLLRARLERAESAKRGAAPGKTTRRKRTATERVADIALDGQASREDIYRALISGILEEEFGKGVAADVRFQELVSDVVRIVSDDTHHQSLITQAVDELTNPRR